MQGVVSEKSAGNKQQAVVTLLQISIPLCGGKK